MLIKYHSQDQWDNTKADLVIYFLLSVTFITIFIQMVYMIISVIKSIRSKFIPKKIVPETIKIESKKRKIKEQSALSRFRRYNKEIGNSSNDIQISIPQNRE